MGIVLVAFLAARISVFAPATTMTSTLRRTSSAASSGQPIELPLRISELEGDVLSFHVAKVTQSLPNSFGTAGLSNGVARNKIPYPGNFLRLLCLGYHSESKQYHCNKD